MIKNCKQGDIFEIGNYGDFQFILVFAPHGMALHGTWRRFTAKHLNLLEIDDPYGQLATPTEFMDRRWIQFAESDQGLNGMDDNQLEKALAKAFSWALENGTSKVITTGIRDIPFDQPEEPRVAFIKEICSREEYDQLEITLISRDKSYIDGQNNNRYSRYFLSEPDICKIEVKVSEEENELYYSEKIDNNEIEPLKEFYVVATPQPSQMQYMVRQMGKTFHGLFDGKIPNDSDYTTTDLKKYCQSLVARQSNENRSPMFGYWSAVKDITDMPRDLKDSCLYFSTIIAVATLSRVLLDFPEIALKTRGFNQALQLGFRSCLRNRILGTRLPNSYSDGYFEQHDFIESIELLCKGGVLQILNYYQDYSNERLIVIFEELKIRLTKDLDCGYIERRTSLEYADKCQSALELLLKNKS